MKVFYLMFFSLFSAIAFAQIQHCGYDFTSYLVVDAHENGKMENIKELKVTIVDENGKDAINVNNMYSWNKANLPLLFAQNYLISKEGEKERYFFPYAKDQYFLSVTNTFPAEQFSIKIEDPKGIFQTQVFPLQSYNLYILCSAENERQARSFGPRSNKPIEIILEKK